MPWLLRIRDTKNTKYKIHMRRYTARYDTIRYEMTDRSRVRSAATPRYIVTSISWHWGRGRSRGVLVLVTEQCAVSTNSCYCPRTCPVRSNRETTINTNQSMWQYALALHMSLRSFQFMHIFIFLHRIFHFFRHRWLATFSPVQYWNVRYNTAQ